MSNEQPGTARKFDAYASDYATIHAKNIAASGESPVYFAEYKRHCLERLVGPEYQRPVLDFGCGVGQVTEQIAKRFTEVHGYDPSPASLEAARARLPEVRFHAAPEAIPEQHFGLAILSGVLHHVAPAEREELLRGILAKLEPGGRVVVFEHNPLNPLTRKVVRECPFDDDALLLGPYEAKRLLRASGFARVERRFIVFLPRPLAALRFLEPYLWPVPLGAQMMLVGHRPD